MVFGRRTPRSPRTPKEELAKEVESKIKTEDIASTPQTPHSNPEHPESSQSVSEQPVKINDGKPKKLGLPAYGGELEEDEPVRAQPPLPLSPNLPSDNKPLLNNTSKDNYGVTKPVTGQSPPSKENEFGATNEFWNTVKGLVLKILEWPILIHVVIVISITWILGSLNVNGLLVVSWMVVFLWQVHVRQIGVQRSQVRSELLKEQMLERDIPEEESTRWLNEVLERAWPIWIERVVSLKMVPLLAPWFLQTYKPGILTKLDLKTVHMGSKPPVVRGARVYRANSPGNHLVMEMDVELAGAKDMYMQFVAKIGSSWAGLGLIPWTAYATDLHLIGRMRVGVQFSPVFPFVNHMEMAFVCEPKISLSVKVMGLGLGKGFDAAGLPLVASFVDTTLKRALKGSIVAPNKLVINDVVLLVQEIFHDVDLADHLKPSDGKGPVLVAPPATDGTDMPPPELKKNAPDGYVMVEVLEGQHLMAADKNGFSDPYVKGRMGKAKFVSSIKRTTLSPEWLEEFKVEIPDWSKDTVLYISVRDYDRFTSDDDLGTCEIDVSSLRDGKRHDMWIKLSNATTGSLHLAITVFEEQEGDDVEKSVHEAETDDGTIATVHTSTVKKESGDVLQASVTLKNPKLEGHDSPVPPPVEPKLQPTESELKRRAVHLNDSATKIAPGCVIVRWDL